MSEHFWLGMVVILVSGVFNGGFALPMKYSRRWQWENTWLVYACVGLVIVPWSLAAGFVPRLAEVYRGAAGSARVYALVFGFLWGIAQVTFGLGIKMVGVALTFAVVSGLASLSGSLVPLLVFAPADLFRPRGLLLLMSIPLLLVGLTLYALAGRGREKEQAVGDRDAGALQSSFAAGLAICIFTGIFGANFNLGFAFGNDIIRSSVEQGASRLASTYAVWALVLGGGFLPNLIYCTYRLFRNRTLPLFFRAGAVREGFLAIGMGILWVTGILSYGIGATLVGRYGTSIGFMLFIASSILSANLFGMLAGEWKATSPKTRTLLSAALAFILGAVVVLNLGGLF
jgi:L-rhamnose-H+ transport protein